MGSKRKYVTQRLDGKSMDELIELAKAVQTEHPNFQLEEAIWKLSSGLPAISEITRRCLTDSLSEIPNLSGNLEIVEFLEPVFPLSEMPPRSGMSSFDVSNLRDEVIRHMVRNEDWSWGELFEVLNLQTVSLPRFFRFLERTVHPMVRRGQLQDELVARLNEHLAKDRLRLLPADPISGYPSFRLGRLSGGVHGTAKNLIFAAKGPKPQIVLADAINNDIRIVKNADNCLVYDRPLSNGGLMWAELLDWWLVQADKGACHLDPEKGLYLRLKESLASDAERLLFHEYYREFKSKLGDQFPALIPQVYLHYDPYTIKQLTQKRLARQRMDFLLLLPQGTRVVIEVDGKEHYSSDGNQPSPQKYSQMVAADRDLRWSAPQNGYHLI